MILFMITGHVKILAYFKLFLYWNKRYKITFGPLELEGYLQVIIYFNIKIFISSRVVIKFQAIGADLIGVNEAVLHL